MPVGSDAHVQPSQGNKLYPNDVWVYEAIESFGY